MAPDFQQLRGHRKGHRTKDEPGRPEQNQAADHRNEGEDGVQFQPLPDQDGAQQVVNGADDQSAPRRENQGFPPTAFQRQKKGRPVSG